MCVCRHVSVYGHVDVCVNVGVRVGVQGDGALMPPLNPVGISGSTLRG